MLIWTLKGDGMSAMILRTFNHYAGRYYTPAEAAAFVAGVRVLPLPDRVSLDDWRVHVPMHLLEGWANLSDEERLAVYVMAQSATHPYECNTGPEEPAMN
jgi:hypothetical protein